MLFTQGSCTQVLYGSEWSKIVYNVLHKSLHILSCPSVTNGMTAHFEKERFSSRLEHFGARMSKVNPQGQMLGLGHFVTRKRDAEAATEASKIAALEEKVEKKEPTRVTDPIYFLWDNMWDIMWAVMWLL